MKLSKSESEIRTQGVIRGELIGERWGFAAVNRSAYVKATRKSSRAGGATRKSLHRLQ